MEYQWKSSELHEHPAKHQTGVCGYVVLSKAGVYAFRAGGTTMSCPQDWAAKIHKNDQEEEKKMGRPSVGEVTLPGITVPEKLRDALRAKAETLGLSDPDARREAYRKFVE